MFLNNIIAQEQFLQYFYRYSSKRFFVMTSVQIGILVRNVRKKSGLTQLQLADLAGIGKTAVFDLEKGKATIELKTLLAVLQILNIKISLETPFSNSSEF